MLSFVGRPRGPSSEADRGLANVVGFIVVFSFLIVTFIVYQGVVVPDQNRRIEFDHNRQIQGDMHDLRDGILSAARGLDASVSLKLGADYPRRAIARNLGQSGGTIQTDASSPEIVTLENVTSIDNETNDYVGNDSSFGPFETSAIVYQPTYTRYSNAPSTVYENTLLVNQFRGGDQLAITDQAIVNDREITVILVQGQLSEASGDTKTVDASAVSAAVDPVAVTADNGPLTLTIPTRLSTATWAELLDDEQHVQAVKDAGDGRVTIVLEEGITYDLRLASVNVGSGGTTEGPQYITDIAGDGTSIPEGGTRQLVVEVRDRYNNPVSNVTVEAAVTSPAASGDGVSPASANTDSRGRAAFSYEAPADIDQTRSATVTVFFESMTESQQNVTFEIDVLDADGSGEGECGETVGRGNAERWCPPETNFALAQPGGVLEDIGAADSVNLSNPVFASLDANNGDALTDGERFRLVFVLERDQADLSGTTRYLFVIPDDADGYDQRLGASGTSIQNRDVIVYKDDAVNDDGTGYTIFVEAPIRQNDINEWYNGDRAIDVLDESHYSRNPDFSEIRTFMRNNDVRMYFVEVHGRVDIAVG